MVYFIGPEKSIKSTTTTTANLSEQRLYETTSVEALGLYWGQHDRATRLVGR